MKAFEDALLSHPAMEALWSDENCVRTWLETERALSEALAAEGLIPKSASEEIERVARLENLRLEPLVARTRELGMPIKPLVEAVVAAGGPLTAKYFHWGATTQDILDTAQALRLRDSLKLIGTQLRSVLIELVKLAETHQDTPMVGRTNSQDALPTTWGLQVSGYAAELVRHIERLRSLAPRASTIMFGGAVGTLAALGDHGLRVRRRLSLHLNLPEPLGAWNGSQDTIVEVVQLMALILGSLVRLANDVELMGRAALGELGRIGSREGASSTMPHKTNPRDANAIQTSFQLGTMYAAQAPHLMDQIDVRAASHRVMAWRVVPGGLGAASAGLARAERLLTHLKVNPDRMRANFEHSRGLVLSESVMFALAEKTGRDEAYRLVQRALAEAPEGSTLLQAVVASPGVAAHLNEGALRHACEPSSYLGQSRALVNEVLTRARAVLAEPEPGLISKR